MFALQKFHVKLNMLEKILNKIGEYEYLLTPNILPHATH